MNITDVEIGGFGIWKNLEITNLEPGLTVFYGPNEAGKSTIMQFMRAMLYGFTPARRTKYLPPVLGGKAGGRLALREDREHWNLRRSDVGEQGLGALSLIGPDDHEHGDLQLRTLLGDVDENTYSNVFSLSLHELQELSTLQETDAGRLLYEMSAGLDRVSLGDVLRELQTSRSRLMTNGEKPSQITDLLSQRDRLRAELDQLTAGWRGRRRLSDERLDLERAITAAQQEQGVLTNELRSAEAAWAMRDMWSARANLNDQLNSIGPIENVPSDAVERMDYAVSVLKRGKFRRRKIVKKRDELKAAYDAITLNQNLWKQAPRILALTEHEPWLAALDLQNRESKTQASTLEKKLQVLKQQLGPSGEVVHESMSRKLSGVLSVAKQLRQAALRLKDAKNSITNSRGSRDDNQIEIDELLAARGESSLTGALDKTGQMVSLYRRRLHLDERLDQMARSKADLEFDLREYAELQMIPTWALVGLGAMFVFGAGLVLGGLVLPAEFTGNRNFPMVIFGVIAAGISTMIKSHLEHTSARKADGCQKQLTLIARQIEQATEERDELDQQIPDAVGTLSTRLEIAENELARLEELVPLESMRLSSHQESATIRERAKAARINYEKARKRWVASLAAAKLPESWSPSQVRDLAKQYAEVGQVHKQVESSQADQDRRLREAASLKTRVEQLFIDAGITPETNILLEQIRQLRKELATHEAKTTEKNELKTNLLKYRRKVKSYDRTIRKYEKQREVLLRGVNAVDEVDFRNRVQKYLQLHEITRKRDNFAQEINKSIQGYCSEEDLIRWFRPGSRENLETRLPEMRSRMGAVQERLRQLFEKRGALQQQAKLAIEDRRFASKQLELNIVEQKLADAAAKWRTYTVTHALLDNLKLEYERNRQPETLREASEFLSKFTSGQYQRVWTPLGEGRLCVDDHDGRPVPVEQLSRGTREQLFLSLRLALTSWYAKRGKRMPLVLDDVLVNFDNVRAEAAATVLRDFANEGHQLLLFTCHEHIGRIFKNLSVDVRQLPTHEAPDKWPVFEGREPQTRYIEVIKPVEVIKEVIKEVVREREPIEVESWVEPAPEPIKIDPPRRRRKGREQIIEQPVRVEAPEPVRPRIDIPTVFVNPPALAMEYVERAPQPPSRPNYETTAPRVIKVYEQPLRDYPAQPRPQPVPFTPPQPYTPPQQFTAPQPSRVDPPQQVIGTWVAERKRWNAEEFEGELDDQVRRQQRLARAAAAAEAAAAQHAAATNYSYQQPVVVQSTYVPQAPQHVSGVTEMPVTARYTTGVTSYATGTSPNRTIIHDIGRESTHLSSNGGKLRRTRRVRIVEDHDAAEVDQANAELQGDPNHEPVDRIRYYDAEIDD
jgi:uncharacterized protein YhaN